MLIAAIMMQILHSRDTDGVITEWTGRLRVPIIFLVRASLRAGDGLDRQCRPSLFTVRSDGMQTGY